MRQLERWMALRAINDRWMEHLANMDYLREGIGLRGYEQKDPLLIYQKEAFDEFERMQQAIQDDIVRNLFRTQVVTEPQRYVEQPEEFELPPNVAPAIPLPAALPRPVRRSQTTPGDVAAALEPPRSQFTNITANREGVETASMAGESDGNANGTSRKPHADGAPADWKGGRNDACWCGSGEKYKRCHGKV